MFADAGLFNMIAWTGHSRDRTCVFLIYGPLEDATVFVAFCWESSYSASRRQLGRSGRFASTRRDRYVCNESSVGDLEYSNSQLVGWDQLSERNVEEALSPCPYGLFVPGQVNLLRASPS